jgi:hypothetical protein
MKRSNLVFFIEQIVDLSIANQSLCDERKENETRIKKLEAKLKANETESMQKDMLIYELQSTDGLEAAHTYQKELVKAERENKILANELLAITNQTATMARPKISIREDSPGVGKWVIDKFVDFDHPHTIDILAKHEARINAEEEMHAEMIFDQEPTDNVHTRSSSGKLSMVEEIKREQMQNDILDEVARKKAEDEAFNMHIVEIDNNFIWIGKEYRYDEEGYFSRRDRIKSSEWTPITPEEYDAALKDKAAHEDMYGKD